MRAFSCIRGVVLITAALTAEGKAQTSPSVERLMQTSAAQTESAPRDSTLERNVARRTNNWTIALAGRLPGSTILRFAAEIPRNLNDGDEDCVLPTVTPRAVKPAGPLASNVRIAQRADSPVISIPSPITGEPGSVIPLPIRIDPLNALHKNTYVRLSGIPRGVTLSAGNLIENWWIVPLFELPNLRVNIPTGVSGRAEIIVILFNLDGTTLATAETLLIAGSSGVVKTVKTPIDVPEKPAGIVTPRTEMSVKGPDRLVPPVQLSIEDKARAEQLVAQGEKYLADANINVARQFFRRAADLGLAAAALRLAATFDPGELARLQVHGVVPNPDEARKWYERARQLGASEAEIRLTRSLGN
jgi:hypothetical protein